jgi:hypothetical protein
LNETARPDIKESTEVRRRDRKYEIPLEERETGYVLDYHSDVARIWTNCPAVARDWQRKGYGQFIEIGHAPNGRAVSWKGAIPLDAVRPLARFENGAVKRRRGHKKGGALLRPAM